MSCSYEENILALLKQEEERLSKLIVDKNTPYFKSLTVGISNAEKKLEECLQKQCIQTVYKQNPGIIPSTDLRGWSILQIEIAKCKKLF